MHHHKSSSGNFISHTSFLSGERRRKNISLTNNTSTSSTMMDFREEGIALVSAYMTQSGLIVGGNVLAIVLFVLEKKLRKKSLSLVINMVLANVMLGAVSLPLCVYLYVGPVYQLWTTKAYISLFRFYRFFDTALSQSSLISAGFISCESLYAIYWPLKHRTLSMRTYCNAIFMIWFLAILLTIVHSLAYYLKSLKTAFYSWVSFPLSFLLIVHACNISIWRKILKRNIALQQQNRMASRQNQRLTKTLLFVSALSVLSWLPLVIVNYLISFQGIDITRHFLFYMIINILNFSNSFLNPVVYALKIPEFRRNLVLYCSQCQAREGKENMVAILTPVLQLRTLHLNSSQEQPTFEQETLDTKL